MAYEILVLDIDGTLTNSEKLITGKTKEALFALQERGHKVVLASGRPTPGIIPVAEQIRLKEYGGYILAYNGAKVLNCQTGEVIYEKSLPKESIKEIYDAAKEFKTGLLSYDKEGIITPREPDEYIQKEAMINHLPIKKVDNFVEYIDYPVNKCLLTENGLYLAEVEKELKNRFRGKLNVYRSEPFFLEIMPENIDKAYSLGKLLEKLGMTKDQMICCGDGYNDLSMIEYAGMGVAMANANDQVKEAADFITLSNDEDGVAHVIDRFM
ncbi:Cof-type HAD-IIB family hydrolase [[Clostridium] polysaccharolyticum]|uniref:Haloacid dehalogenase-like hydrolase n=1 Tax=[Clostridium] polysaccharolyticum TaxID=29364 RepID=A0A1I0C5J4_9FIRM|nr:Cof-type HAD-IIB family hydrolase [[Clostridium] polysaccharolyticum]SET14739.1 hypothetical protein SAMN04487772_10933 [[Clostridium] polysaccharolyticum]